MEECRIYKQKNPTGSTARFEYTMRSAYQALTQSVRSLERLASEYENAPGRFPQVKDKQRRIDRVNEFVKIATGNLQDYEMFVK